MGDAVVKKKWMNASLFHYYQPTQKKLKKKDKNTQHLE